VAGVLIKILIKKRLNIASAAPVACSWLKGLRFRVYALLESAAPFDDDCAKKKAQSSMIMEVAFRNTDGRMNEYRRKLLPHHLRTVRIFAVQRKQKKNVNVRNFRERALSTFFRRRLSECLI